jgi:hypothetical protein
VRVQAQEEARVQAQEEVGVQARDEARPEDVARSSRRDDISSALHGLGFTVVEAKRGVELDRLHAGSLARGLRTTRADSTHAIGDDTR